MYIFSHRWVQNFCARGALTAPALRADSVWVTSGTHTVQYEQGKIVRVDQDQFVFRTPQGNESIQPASRVSRLAIDDEHSLTAAEQARAAAQWDIATDGYSRTLGATDKAWLKDWAALRLLESAGK